MESILLIVHVIIALAIVGLILLQQGKGAEMGASFGAGSSQTVFGAAGSGNFFSRMTGLLVAVFFATSLVLALISKQSSNASNVEIPGSEVVEQVEDAMPSVAPSDDAIPAGDSIEPVLEIPAAAPSKVEVPEASAEPAASKE